MPLEISVKSLKEFFTNKVSFSRPANYMSKFNSRNTRTRCEICLKLTIRTQERRQWRRSDAFIANFELVPLLVLVFLLLILSRQMLTRMTSFKEFFMR